MKLLENNRVQYEIVCVSGWLIDSQVCIYIDDLVTPNNWFLNTSQIIS